MDARIAPAGRGLPARPHVAEHRRQPARRAGCGGARQGARGHAVSVTHDSLKLTAYYGEGDDLSDPMLALFARHRLRTSILLRGAEGFGAKHRLHSGRLLTLSEDLPLVALAVDEPERVEAVMPEVEALVGEGLVTLERADATAPHEEAKLTVYCGRHQRAGGRPAFVAAVECLRARGIAG